MSVRLVVKRTAAVAALRTRLIAIHAALIAANLAGARPGGVGLAIPGIFVACLLASMLIYRIRSNDRIEERRPS